MEVTDILRARQHESVGLQRMVSVSLAAHAALVVAILVAPGGWLSQPAEPPRTVMTISLGGGGDEPRSGGLTTMGGRPVQVQTPPDAPKRPEAVRPPAAKTPEMTLSKPNARPASAASTPVRQAPDDARGRAPTHGAETSAGSAVAMTGARGQGFGLSSGGGPGAGATLDVADFCCPDYIVTMIERIKANWNPNQNVAGQTIVRFLIRRDGTLQDATVERSSGYPIPDLAAQRAVIETRQLPPLPATFPNATLTVHLNFQYQR
jgi:protein TonB